MNDDKDESMDINDCHYEVKWSEEDRQFVGTVQEFPSLSWLDDSPEASLSGIQRIVLEAASILDK